MRTLVHYFVRHRTAANLLMAFALAIGLGSALTIRTQFFPDVVVDTATVRVAWPGAGPADMDAAVVAVLEPGLRALDGVAETRTSAREGSAAIVVELEPGAALEPALAEIEAAVDAAAADLPDGAEAPEISRGRFRDLVTNVSLTGGGSRRVLLLEAERLRAALFAAGVTRVEIEGAVDPILRIEPDPAALEREGLEVRDIAARVAAEAEARPLGGLEEGGPRLRLGEDRRVIERLAAIPLRDGADGARLRLGDVARIRLIDGDGGAAEAGGVAIGASGQVVFFSAGRPALRLRVERGQAGDAVAIQRTVERVVADYRAAAPETVAVELTQTRAQAIADRLDILYRNGVSGLAIVVALLFLFLSARTALWVAAGVPVAMFATIALMQLGGLSLNMISLFALILCLGIVVDDAIVVGEHADRLHRDGASPSDAAAGAALAMAGPVTSAAVTTVFAFAALTTIGGRFGSFIGDLPLTVIAVLIASLVECFLILPAHMRHALAASARGAARSSWIDAPSRAVNRGFDRFRDRIVRPAIGHVLRLRYPLIAGFVALLLSAVALRLDGTVPWFFFNAPERGTVRANIVMAPGATRADTFAMLEEMRRALEAVDAALAAEHGARPVLDATATLGANSGRALAAAETADPDRLGGFEVELIDPDLRPYGAFDVLRAWEREIRRPALLETLAMRGDRSGPSGDAIEVELSGEDDPAVLKAAAEALILELAELPGAAALEDSMPYDRAELTLTLTPRGAALGFQTEAVAEELRARLEGVEAAQFALGGREAIVEVGFAPGELDAAFVTSTRLATPEGGRFAAADIAEITETRAFASVRRLNGRIVVTVNGELPDDPEIRAEAARALETRILPEIEARFGVAARQGGVAEQERDFLRDAAVGFGLALLGIYVALAWALASWSRPALIVLAVPFGFVGAIWGHHLHGVPLSMFSVVGFLGLAGVLVNDSIVLVARIDELAERHAIRTAVVAAVCDRLRAILLTSLTTIGGLAPLLFERSQQALFLKPTVITLAYGMGFGFFVALLLVPALVLVSRDIGQSLTSARRLVAHLRRPRPGLGAKQLGGRGT